MEKSLHSVVGQTELIRICVEGQEGIRVEIQLSDKEQRVTEVLHL